MIKWLNRKYLIWVEKRVKWAAFNYDFYASGLCLTSDALRELKQLTLEYRLLYGVCGLSAVGQVSGFYARIPIGAVDNFVSRATAILLDGKNLVLEGGTRNIGATLFYGNTLSKKDQTLRQLLTDNPDMLKKYLETHV